MGAPSLDDAGPPIPPPVRARIYLTRGPSVGFPTKVCLSPNENPARIPIGAGSREPSHLLGGARRRGLHFGKLVGTRKVPHGTSGTNSPYHTLLEVPDH